MLQMAMLLCMGMLTVGHRKVSQLGEVTISFLCGANGRQKDQQTDGQTDWLTDRAPVHDRFKARGTAASRLCSPAPPLP